MAETTLWRALNDSLRSLMAEDPRVFLMGQDMSGWGSGGGVYGVTRGLLKEFGVERVRDTPISEEGIVSAAVGAALAGQRPIVEIMSADFSLLAFDPIVNQAAKARYMFGGQFDVPLVIRAAAGTGSGRAAHHTQSLETLFAHIPGLEVVLPATPHDAAWLIRASVRSPNPTIFLEQKGLYNVRGAVSAEPVELGVARVARRGRDVLLVASQLMVHRGLAAAAELSQEGVEVEVIDIRTLYPLDIDSLVTSASRIGRVLVAHEAPLLFGFGGELAAAVSEACWGKLAAPVRRLGAERSPIPYSPALEEAVVPSQARLTNALRELARA